MPDPTRPATDRPAARPSTCPLERFRHQRTVLLTTVRRDGRGGDAREHRPGRRPRRRALVEHVGEAKRLRRDPHATIASSTVRGRPTGEALDVTLRLLTGDEDRSAGRALRGKHPVRHGVLVPLVHPVNGLETVHYAVRPA